MAESHCLENCKADEPRFILCARDPSAPTVVREWADRAGALGAPAEKTVGARIVAENMERWQEEHPELVKVPD